MEEQLDLKQDSLKQGAILGMINIIIGFLVYFIDPAMMAGMSFGFLVLGLNLAYVVYAGIQYRKEIGGFLSFGKAYMHGFIMLLVAGLIGAIFRIVLFHVIDPDLIELMVDVSVENAAAMMEKFGAGGDQMEEALDQVREDMPANFSVFGILKGYLFSIIFFAIVSLISGAIVKKKDPAMEM